MSLLNIQKLNLSIHDEQILYDVNLRVERGQVVAVVGESGSGKSMTASGVMQLMPDGATIDGQIWLNDDDLTLKTEKEMCRVRANDIGMIFQEPMTALNPVQTIGAQVIEAVRITYKDLSKNQAIEKAEIALHRVGLPQSRFPLSTYPHKLSGGQRQRVVIAIALCQNPKLLIADEPTTALDVTTQANILKLLKKLVKKDNMGLLLISHDLGVVAEVADHIVIMRDGRVIEEGSTHSFFNNMKEDYSKELVAASNQKLKDPLDKQEADIILEVKNLHKEYKLARKSMFAKGEILQAVNDVSFSIKRGENLGLVGESGCGKSTLTRCILGVDDFQSGEILINGQSFNGQKELRKHINVVFQDPYGSFNPRHSVERLISEPFYLLDKNPSEKESKEQVIDLDKYPHEFSGGQRQRIAIARALITKPSVILLDEATSALDVLIRGQILELLEDLSKKRGISYLFISHDLATVKNITDRIMVMKDGIIVEEGQTADIYLKPTHPYTKTLLAASPDITKAIENI